MILEFGKPYHNKAIDRCRTIGRFGGLRSARNRRQRRLAQPTPTSISLELKRETAHEASVLLDAKFPWLKDAWMRPARWQTAQGLAHDALTGALGPLSSAR